ncbi:MAG: type VI secretion system membrane subunit TssM [Polyangiales bacterium]
MLIKLLIGSLVTLVVLFIALVWLVADLLHWSWVLPAAVTAFCVLAGSSAYLYQRWRASGAAAGLEQGLAEQAKEQAKLVRPELQAEVAAMQGELEKAIAALKSAKLGPGGRTALYFLPWYAIIGPPGAGKSTALRNSGLHFPYTSGTGGPSVKGLGGTRNCDWWLTNEAVMLDTAGRWSTQEEDHDEWLSFLGLLKRYRPRKPLNGLIAAISVGDVVNAREGDVEALAQRMRARLDEVQSQLGVSIPVYVLFTKADLVEGFLETFGDLPRSDRAQVWGFTLPLSDATTELRTRFAERFDELANVLEHRSLARMADDRNIERRALIYAFPQQFLALRRNLQRFIEVMFERSVYEAAPSLRGVYFTSGTQEGRPFNLLVNRLVEALGIRRKTAAAESAVDLKSYFLHDLFMQVIFADRDVASASERELRRQRRKRLLLTAALSAVSLAVGIIPGMAWSRNAYVLARIDAAVDEWELPGREPTAAAQKLERLEPLRERVETLNRYEREGVPLSMRLGMYHADQLVEPLQRYYGNLLRRELVQPVIGDDLQHMTDFGLRFMTMRAAKPKEDEQADLYDRLKLHLLLSRPTQRAEPALVGAPAEWVTAQLVERWMQGTEISEDSPQLAAAQVNAALYVSLVPQLSELAFPRDTEVVTRVREALNRVPATSRALARLIALGAEGDFELTLPKLVGASSAFEPAGKVRGAFTRRGFELVVRDALAPPILDNVGELWVLGLADDAEQARAQRAVQLEELRTQYFANYIAEWQSFLRSVRTRVPLTHVDTLELLRELTRGAPAQQALLIQRVYNNLQLTPKPDPAAAAKQAATGALDKVKQGIVRALGGEPQPSAAGDQSPAAKAKRLLSLDQIGAERLTESSVSTALQGYWSFAQPAPVAEGEPPLPVPFGTYKEQLEHVRDALQLYLDNPAQPEQLQSRLQTARANVRSLIEQQETGFRPFFENLLWPPIDGASVSTQTEQASRLGSAWCSDIVTEFSRSLAGHYPFDRNGQDASLADFSNFYRPTQGRLWSFVDSKLKATVELTGDVYSFTRQYGEENSDAYQRELLDFLGRSRDIMLAFFGSGAPEPSVEFEVRVQPSPEVSMTQFSVGGTSVQHYNGPEQWKTLTWPGPNPAAGASIDIRGANGMHERIKQDGPWGLLRVLEAGSLVPDAGRTFTVAWQLQTHEVTLKIDFRPKRSSSPFLGAVGAAPGAGAPRLLAPLRARGVLVPKHIAAQAAACKI